MNSIIPEKTSFKHFKIAANLLAVLDQYKFTSATPIQEQTIPHALEGKDIVGIAQTGTGKTLAFGIPLIQRLASFKGRGLILLPTRELAQQVDETLQRIGKPLGLRTAIIIGGVSMHKQLQMLRHKPHVLVATPGRLVDHVEQKNISLSDIKILVLDEADRMFDIGFMPQIKKILQVLPADRQTMLFSATMPAEVTKLTAQYMKIPLRIEVAPAGTTSHQVEQELFVVTKETKMQLLDKLLADTPGTVLVFSRTKHGAKKIAARIRDMGHSAIEIHSNRSLAQRKAALEGFKSGKYRIMVATDIAARGIDVKNISLVINYDLPDSSEDYVHRIGRTGRAGSFGKAVSFVAPEQRSEIKNIERLIKKALPIMALPPLPAPRTYITPVPFEHPGGGRGNNFRSRRSSGGQNRGTGRPRRRFNRS